jgi:DNA-binding transcriptional LysR family regulator
MDLRQLRTFVTVVEQGTVSKASLRLRTAQPALSRQIRDLEGELGVRLFDRVRRRLVLTGEGEQLLGDCRTVLAAVGSLVERAHGLRRGDSGILRVAATPQTIEGLFSTFLRRYAERRPNVQIKLTEAVGGNLLALLERGEIHLAVALIGLVRAAKGDHHAIESFELSPVELLAAYPASLDLGKRGSVEISGLATHPLLLLDSSFYVRNTFDAACRLAGVTPDVFIESRTPHALLALAEAGHGVAIIPSVLPTKRYRLRVARITHRRRPLRESHAVLWDKRRVLPPYARDFCETLATHMRELFPIPLPPKARGGAKVPHIR